MAASSCHRANTLSTAAIVRGAAALPWLRELGVAARLVDAQGTVTLLGGWPAEPLPGLRPEPRPEPLPEQAAGPARDRRASAHSLVLRRATDGPSPYRSAVPLARGQNRPVV